VGVAALVLAASAACGALSPTGTPSAEECVNDWNDLAGRAVQEQVTVGEYTFAAVRGWVAKESYPGCSLRFMTDEEVTSWLSCIRTFEAAVARLKRWSCEAHRDVVPDTHRSVARAEVVSGWRLDT
jgi:hypothetical protein